jgi:hypothetical protein
MALQSLPGTELVLTVTSGLSSVVRGNRKLRIVKAPHQLHPFHFLMAWHPRLNTDPRHMWLCEQCDQQLRLSMSNPMGSKISVQIERALLGKSSDVGISALGIDAQNRSSLSIPVQPRNSTIQCIFVA